MILGALLHEVYVYKNDNIKVLKEFISIICVSCYFPWENTTICLLVFALTRLRLTSPSYGKQLASFTNQLASFRLKVTLR